MSRMPQNYRPEIDGLRAIAVLSVVLYHAFPSLLPGGFIGVDIFFVISGYLITKIITDTIEKGNFKLADFFERRIRRILPALYLMASLVSLLSYINLFPYNLSKFGESLTSLPLFVSNIYFWLNIDYFSSGSELRPLIHTWSLAVEEQFYIVYPFLVLLVFKKSLRLFIAMLWLVTLLSFFLSVIYTPSHSVASFFLPFTRAWEISFGCLLFLHEKRINSVLNQTLVIKILSLLGILLIFYSLFFFNHRTLFPSFNALYPVAGTCLLIACSSKAGLMNAILRFKPLVSIGLFSYSIYIFHHPIFAISRHIEIFTEHKLILLVFIFLLSFLSFKFVEIPFRNKELISSKRLFIFISIGTMLLAFTGMTFKISDGFPGRYNIEDKKIMRQYFDYQGYNQKYFYSRFEKPFDAEKKAKVLLVGDSFARDFANVIRESTLSENIQISTWYVSSDCGNLYLDNYDEIKKYLKDERHIPCQSERFYDSEHFKKLASTANEIWLINSWEDYVIDRLPISIDKIQQKYKLKVRVFGTKNFGNITQRKILSIKPSHRPNFHQDIRAKAKFNMKKMDRLFHKSDFYFPIADLICGGSVTKCKIFDLEGQVLSTDGGHLTQAGVVETIKRLSPVISKISKDMKIY